jgi:hypothetical protein
MSTAVSFVRGRETFVMIAEGHDFGVVDEPVDHGRGFRFFSAGHRHREDQALGGASAFPVA